MSSISLPKATASYDSSAERVHLHGDGDEFIILGNKKYYRHELMSAFAGTFNPDRLSAPPKHEFGNASALGLACFALTTFVLGLFYSGAMGISTPNVVVSLCIFYGGAIELLAGIFEMVIGNTFAATTFISYGAFWISFGAIYIESFGIQAAYKDAPDQLANGIGFILIGWGIFTFMLLMLTVKSTLAFVLLFVTLDLAFFLLAAANFTGGAKVSQAGGICAVISAICGWYAAFAGVANKQNSYLRANPIFLPILDKTPQ